MVCQVNLKLHLAECRSTILFVKGEGDGDCGCSSDTEGLNGKLTFQGGVNNDKDLYFCKYKLQTHFGEKTCVYMYEYLYL